MLPPCENPGVESVRYATADGHHLAYRVRPGAAGREVVLFTPGGTIPMEFLERDPPFGIEVSTQAEVAVPGWRTEARGPAFDAARRALAAGYGRPCELIGCGGTIPFVGPFLEVLGGAPALLLGLEDPPCNAHGENESLELADFRKATLSVAHLVAVED